MFSWIKPVFQTQEEVLFKMIGYDAVLFIRFMRMLRRLLYWMTAIGVCVLIPINVIATSYTGFVFLRGGKRDSLIFLQST